jgi:hypothetical protein
MAVTKSDARLGRALHLAPVGAVVGQVGQGGAVAAVGLVDPGAQPRERRIGHQGHLLIEQGQPPPAHVVAEPLHDRPGERLPQHALQPRQIEARDLILQRLGGGTDDHLAPGENGGHQIGERLAGAGARLDQQALVVVEGAGDAGRHRHLSGAVLVAGEGARQAPTGAEQLAERHRDRLAFSSMPDTPKRRRSCP